MSRQGRGRNTRQGQPRQPGRQHNPERRHTQPPSLGVPTPPTTGPAYSPEALAALVNATAHATTRGGEPMKLLDAQGQSIQLASGMAGQALGQAASGTVGRQYPDMLKVSSAKPPLKSLGATGTAIFSGIITSEEYNPDFYWRDAVQIYEQMIRNDAQVFAAIQMLELPIRRATWSIEPATDSLVDKEIASFVETALFHDLRYQTASGRWLTQKWDDVLRHILMMFRFGFMPFEVCFRVDPGGWVKWSRFIPLLPRTVYRWWVGADNELAGIQQWTYKNYSYQYIDIPADKLLLFVHRQEGNNYEGVPVLRSAYKNWYYKDNFYKIEAVAIERNAISVPVIGLPENFTDSDIQAAQKITANLRANENLGVTLPPGWTFEYARNQQKYAAGTEQPIAHHDVMIARNILAQFINLGSTETGAFALDASQKATFLAALQAQAEYIEDVFNSDAIPRLVDYNYAGVSVYPRLKCSKVLAQDFDQIASAINKLASNVPKPYITPDPELEDFLRNELGLPSAPASVVQSYNPSQQSAEGQQEPGAGQPGTNAAGPQAGQAGLPSENETGDGGDDGGDGGGGGGGALSEVRLLRESLDAVMGLDAVSRGKRSREARESIKLFNPRHDPKTGQFAPGGVTTATRGGQGTASTSLAHLEAAHARAGAEYTRLLGEHRAAAHAAGDALRALGDDRAELTAHTADEAGPHGDYQRALAHVKDLEGQVKAAAAAKARAWGALDQARGGTGVRIERAGEDATALRHVLGHELTDHELVALAGAGLGDTLHVQGARTKTGEPEVRLYVQGARTQHTMRLSREGADVVAHEEYLENKGTRGTESGHELLAGMETLRAAGVTKVRASAARAEGLNGYDTWAKLGFDGPLPAGVRAAAQERFGAHVGRVSDVLRQPGGQAWWKQHGATFDAEFDFTPGSHSMTRYEALRDRLARHNKLDELDDAADAGLDFLGVLMLVEEEDGYQLDELAEDFDGDAGSIRLFNPNHDPHTGQFAPGGMGGLHAATGHVHGATGGSIHGAGSRMAAHGHSTGGSGGAGSGGAGRPHPGHQWEARRQQAHDELRQAEQDHADADRRLKQATAEAGRAQVEHARAMDALDAAKRALRVDPGNAALRAEVDQRVRAAAQKSIEHDDARQAMADRERDLSDAAQNHRDAERMVHATERAVQTGEHPDDLFDHMDAHGQVMPFTDHDVFDAWNTGTANTGPQNTPGHGWTSTESRTADLGGQKYYLKRNEDVPGPTGQLLASSEGQARSESATVAGLRALGMGDLAPREAYHVVGSDGLHYSVISGEPGERLDRAAFDQATMSDVLDHARGEDLQRLVVGQYLLGVRDRHTGNLLYDAQTGGVKAIDFGLGLRENPHADQAAADRVLLLRQAAKRAGVDFMRMRVVNTLAPHVRLDPAMVHAALSHEPEVLKVLEDFGASRMAKSAARQRFAIVRALAAQHPQGMSVQDLLNAAGTAAY